MGWLWSSPDDSKPSDPLRDLDPSLRDFLKKESPLNYDSTNPPSQQQPSTASKLSPPTSASASASETKTYTNYPTQYKDGRYADLWKTYQPLNDIENSAKSDQEKISDVIDAYKHRRTEINRAALENCALEQWAVQDCFDKGGWSARATMCRKENRKFNRCYELQAKFLKALGYLSTTMDREGELNEQIQMHADTLYQRMLKQEEQIEEAKAAGKEVPKFPPLLSDRFKFVPESKQQTIRVEDLSPAVQAGFKKRLEGKNGEEREVEERAIRAELQSGEDLARNLESMYDQQKVEREARRKEGKERIGDRFSSVFGFGGAKPVSGTERSDSNGSQ